jgi:hypothetical protein
LDWNIDSKKGFVKKLFLYFFMSIIFLPDSLYAMQFLKQRIAQMDVKMAVTVSLFAGLHYGLAYGLILGSLAKDMYVPIDESQKITPAVEKFAKEQLKKCGYTTFERLKIVKYNVFAAKTTFSHDYLFFNSFEAKRLESILHASSPKPLDDIYRYFFNTQLEQKYKNRVAGMIMHEGGHLIAKISQRTAAAEVAIIGAFEIFSFFFRQRLKPFNNFWVKQSVRLLTGIAKCCGNAALLLAYKRYEEQKADDGIDNDIAILKAVRKDFKKNMGFPSDEPFYSYFFQQTHPSDGDRFQQFTRRINKLEFEKKYASKKENQ